MGNFSSRTTDPRISCFPVNLARLGFGSARFLCINPGEPAEGKFDDKKKCTGYSNAYCVSWGMTWHKIGVPAQKESHGPDAT